MNMEGRNAGPLWAITSYFNPMRYVRRRHNYRLFRERLLLPLVTVELSFQQDFELQPGDAEILLRRSGGDVLWQKERLLNLAVKALPRSCEQVVWIDCDTYIPRPGWEMEVSRRLKDVPLLQPFSLARHLPKDPPLDDLRSTPSLFDQPAATGLIMQGRPPDVCVGPVKQRGHGSRCSGFAWAGRRELLEQCGFYDANVVGGGDLVLLAATYGVHERIIHLHEMAEPRARHYLKWGQELYRAARGEAACLEGDLLHFWHGDVADRRTYERHREFAAFGFDPEVDIALGHDGCWKWSSDKRTMHEYVRNHFARRAEDGASPDAVPFPSSDDQRAQQGATTRTLATPVTA